MPCLTEAAQCSLLEMENMKVSLLASLSMNNTAAPRSRWSILSRKLIFNLWWNAINVFPPRHRWPTGLLHFTTKTVQLFPGCISRPIATNGHNYCRGRVFVKGTHVGSITNMVTSVVILLPRNLFWLPLSYWRKTWQQPVEDLACFCFCNFPKVILLAQVRSRAEIWLPSNMRSGHRPAWLW